jgi:hypothetical protein
MAALQHCTTHHRFELKADTLIGSSSRCDLALRHDSVSRIHASITWLNGGWYVEDRNSKNGTWVNGQRLASVHRPIQVGCVLRFGARAAEEWAVVSVAPPPLLFVGPATAQVPKHLGEASLAICPDNCLLLTVGTATYQLRWRASYVTLLALCAERLNDRRRHLSPDDEGWIDRQVLAESCAREINQDICRIRQAFQKLELFADAESIIEDLREQGKIRLGMYHVSVDGQA